MGSFEVAADKQSEKKERKIASYHRGTVDDRKNGKCITQCHINELQFEALLTCKYALEKRRTIFFQARKSDGQ